VNDEGFVAEENFLSMKKRHWYEHFSSCHGCISFPTHSPQSECDSGPLTKRICCFSL